MPNISTFNPLPQLREPTERSPLAPQRDSLSPSKIWTLVRSVVRFVNQIAQVVNGHSRAIKILGKNRDIDFDLYPFKIYGLNDQFRPQTTVGSSYDPSANWRTVRVRGGFVLTQTLNTNYANVIGTDNQQSYAFYDTLPTSSYDTNIDIVLPPSQSFNWFWIEISGSSNAGQQPSTGSYYLRWSPNPGSSSMPNNPNGWINWPAASGSYLPIGYVDTATSGSINLAYVRQFQTQDYTTMATGSAGGGGWNFRGAWAVTVASGSGYNFQDVTEFGTGFGTGFFLSTINGNSWLPTVGPYWIQLPGGSVWL